MSGGFLWPPDKYPCGTRIDNLYNSLMTKIGSTEMRVFGSSKDSIATVWIAAFVDGFLEKHMEESDMKVQIKVKLKSIEDTGSSEKLLDTLGQIGPHIFLNFDKDTREISEEASVLRSAFIVKGFDNRLATDKSLSIGSTILNMLRESEERKNANTL